MVYVVPLTNGMFSASRWIIMGISLVALVQMVALFCTFFDFSTTQYSKFGINSPTPFTNSNMLLLISVG